MATVAKIQALVLIIFAKRRVFCMLHLSAIVYIWTSATHLVLNQLAFVLQIALETSETFLCLALEEAHNAPTICVKQQWPGQGVH